jgi:hypothetical protein
MLKCRCRAVSVSGTILLLFAAGAKAQTGSQPPAQQDQSSLASSASQTQQKSPQAQSSQSQQQQPQPGSAAAGGQDNGTTQYKNGTSNDRLGFALPNFLTLENSGKVAPLTSGQKFKVVARGSFDYVMLPWYGFLAGISQAENSEPGYGQGAAGYGKRYGAAAADGTIENFMTGAILPSLLHQDPRYFQLEKGGFLHRAGYAVSRILITRTDSGKSQFNYSEVFGSAMSASISTYSYHPHEDRTLRNTASVWGSEIGYDTLTIFVREFWPDIRRKIRKDKQ